MRDLIHEAIVVGFPDCPQWLGMADLWVWVVVRGCATTWAVAGRGRFSAIAKRAVVLGC